MGFSDCVRGFLFTIQTENIHLLLVGAILNQRLPPSWSDQHIMFSKNQLYFPNINTVFKFLKSTIVFYKNYGFSKHATGIPKAVRQDEKIIAPGLEIGPNAGFRTLLQNKLSLRIYEIPPFTI